MKLKVLKADRKDLEGQILDIHYLAPNGKMVVKTDLGLYVLFEGEYEILEEKEKENADSD